MRTIERDIVGALLFSNDQHVLIGKNIKGGVYEDLWVIPGGGIDPGETKEQALARETFEEVGIDITHAKVQFLTDIQSGTAEKTLRDTGERVLVNMIFYDFRIDIDQPAASIPIFLNDDFGYAEWVSFDDLHSRRYSPAVEFRLKSLKLI